MKNVREYSFFLYFYSSRNFSATLLIDWKIVQNILVYNPFRDCIGPHWTYLVVQSLLRTAKSNQFIEGYYTEFFFQFLFRKILLQLDDFILFFWAVLRSRFSAMLPYSLNACQIIFQPHLKTIKRVNRLVL